MAFHCPICDHPTSLKITRTIELPPDSRSDEISLQTIQCARCSYAGIAIYEESRRGRMDEDSFSHIGYHADAESIEVLNNLIKSCPHPREKNCNCETHKKLGSRDKFGRCVGLSLFSLNMAFPLEKI